MTLGVPVNRWDATGWEWNGYLYYPYGHRHRVGVHGVLLILHLNQKALLKQNESHGGVERKVARRDQVLQTY